MFESLCRANRDRIFAEFRAWQNVPEALRSDPEALARYGRGLLAVADWFAQQGSPQLKEVLQGERGDNPILRWRNQFGQAEKLKAGGLFAEAIMILEDIAKEMGRSQGDAVDRYLPMVQGSLGECFFRTGQPDRAYDTTRAALDGCMRGGDVEGVIAYGGNLAAICGQRGEADEARYWLIVTTNAMIQSIGSLAWRRPGRSWPSSLSRTPSGSRLSRRVWRPRLMPKRGACY